MREILFRGKSKETGKWVYGYFYKDLNNRMYIVDNMLNLIEVISKSVGQFTGKFDNINNRMVFEGDLYKIEKHIYRIKFKYSGFIFVSKSVKLHYNLN